MIMLIIMFRFPRINKSIELQLVWYNHLLYDYVVLLFRSSLGADRVSE